jgi:EPS-associated MarR family transcriptional regulator
MNRREYALVPSQQPPKLESEEVLNILKAIKDNPEVTQRELSSGLGISLGKINFLLKALIARGLVKADNFKKSNHKNAYLYYLTPKGVEEKARTTFLFLKRKIDEHERLEQQIRLLKDEVSKITAAGSHTEGSESRR